MCLNHNQGKYALFNLLTGGELSVVKRSYRCEDHEINSLNTLAKLEHFFAVQRYRQFMHLHNNFMEYCI